MLDARDYTLLLFDCFSEAGLDAPARVPRLAIVNPPLWELGHIAWFAEWYILREAKSSHPAAAGRPSLLRHGDDWFDSNTVPHDARWSLGLPGAGALKTYCREVLDRVLDKLSRTARQDDELYPYRLALTHEDMHGEAFAYTLQTLGVAAPQVLSPQQVPAWPQRDIGFAGGSFLRGSAPGNGFIFDNEKWAHGCYVPSFTMEATLVSNAQYAEFVADGGYDNPRLWTPAGRVWLMRQDRSAPQGWQREGNGWRAQRFGNPTLLSPHEPVRHVSLYEAHAYCAWSGRRLPSEAEWEFAVLHRHPQFHWGELWEWTASPFEPYPGFAPDAYRFQR